MLSDDAFKIYRMCDLDSVYEIMYGAHSWIVARHELNPLEAQDIVRYPGAVSKVLDDKDYVIWCECPSGTCRLAKEGNLTNNWWMLQQKKEMSFMFSKCGEQSELR